MQDLELASLLINATTFSEKWKKCYLHRPWLSIFQKNIFYNLKFSQLVLKKLKKKVSPQTFKFLPKKIPTPPTLFGPKIFWEYRLLKKSKCFISEQKMYFFSKSSEMLGAKRGDFNIFWKKKYVFPILVQKKDTGLRRLNIVIGCVEFF